MEKIKIEINTTNAAFDYNLNSELSYILKTIAKDIAEGERKTIIKDINGNKIGKIEYK